jgi:hypothetical protein
MSSFLLVVGGFATAFMVGVVFSNTVTVWFNSKTAKVDADIEAAEAAVKAKVTPTPPAKKP